MAGRTDAPTHGKTRESPVRQCVRAPVPASLRRLEAPASVRVRLGRAGLEAFRHGETWHDVTAWSGPERLAGRWWREGAPRGEREYFTARTSDGMLWLLFRSGRERQWFVEGWWD